MGRPAGGRRKIEHRARDASVAAAGLLALLAAACPARAETPGPDFYRASLSEANIAPTAATAPHSDVEVVGHPRVAVGHPDTLWDREDVARYKSLLNTNADMKKAFEELRASVERRVAAHPNLPQPQRAPDGHWRFPGEYFPPYPGRPDEDPRRRFRNYFVGDSSTISDLGTLYALTDDEKYARIARSWLLSYAHASQYSPTKDLNYRYEQGLSDQLLVEALAVQRFARGYDLVYNCSCWSQEDRKRVHDELLFPFASQLLYPSWPDAPPQISFSQHVNNRGVIGATAVLWAGYATDDQELIDAALYGIHPTVTTPDDKRSKAFPPPKDWVAATRDSPAYGLLTTGFSSVGIRGGTWIEPSPGYSLYVLGSLVSAAEIEWRHGLDLYRINDSILKYMFDAPLLLAYPDLTMPGHSDSRRTPVINSVTPSVYEYAYKRYRDPRYLAIVRFAAGKSNALPGGARAAIRANLKRAIHLDMDYSGDFPPALLTDLDEADAPAKFDFPNANFPLVGFGVLRIPGRDNSLVDLTLAYGPSAPHGHPDKLNLDLFADGDVVMPSPGIDFPYYNNPRIKAWYHTSISHNTLTVDQQPQSSNSMSSRTRSTARADQLVFAPSSLAGMERAYTDTAYPGVTMDRSVCATGAYVADLFGAFSHVAHVYDLAWHFRGAPSSDLPFSPSSFGVSPPDGYNTLTSVRAAGPGAKPWSATFNRLGVVTRLISAGGADTDVFLGDGGFFVDDTSTESKGRPAAATLIERRSGLPSTLFGNVVDVAGDDSGYVKGANLMGGPNDGYGLLRVDTARGRDYCFASYREGRLQLHDFSADALQAFARVTGQGVEALYLGGGTSLEVRDALLTRENKGLAYIEKQSDGTYEVGNPSPSATTVSFRLPNTQDFEALGGVAAHGPRHPVALARNADHSLSVRLDAGETILLTPSRLPPK